MKSASADKRTKARKNDVDTVHTEIVLQYFGRYSFYLGFFYAIRFRLLFLFAKEY